MDDLTLTRLAAEAMGYKDALTAAGKIYCVVDEAPEWAKQAGATGKGGFVFAPLHDKAQCFELVERFELRVGISGINTEKQWFVERDSNSYTVNADLSRAIVTCVAQMQRAKGEG